MVTVADVTPFVPTSDESHGSQPDRHIHRILLRQQSTTIPQLICRCKSSGYGARSATNRHEADQPGREISNAARTVHRQADLNGIEKHRTAL